jgi:prepilin-type N-terminal cleavage/methylation domain-containing protein
MKNKGFTLIEMLGALIILLLIALIAFPNIINVVKKSNSKIDQATEALIISGAKNMIEDDKNKYPLTNGNVYLNSIGANFAR